MLLAELDIENFRSLEKVSIPGLQQLNVLIGPNNSGKSAVLGVVDYLRKVVAGEGQDTAGLVTAGDNRKSLRVRLRFRLGEKERDLVVARLAEASKTGDPRREAILRSQFLRMIEYRFESVPMAHQVAHVVETSAMTEDGEWATIQRTTGDRNASNPATTIRSILEQFIAQGHLDARSLDVKTQGGASINLTYNFGAASPGYAPYNVRNPLWPLDLIREYLNSLFVFNTFRHSTPRLEAQESQRLDSTGSNLAQVLSTIHNNKPARFREIEKFVNAALPYLGGLQTPLRERQTEVGFHMTIGDHDLRLQDTGGGVEQILMVAVVLVTTGSESAVLLEEPENHMHPGAQRFILEQLSASGRQVLLTTHSPIFVNTSQPRSLYRVSYKAERTTVSRVGDPDTLGEVLNEIGARNSDVLMSDGVLFVEGPSDRETLIAWSECLGKDLAGVGVGVVSMGGAGQALKAAPIQTEVMAGVSQKSPIPHLFVLDRDERSDDDVRRLTERLGGSIRFFRRREIENYLLVPRAILEAIREKSQGASKTPPIDSPETLAKIQREINEIASSLYGTVLLKRVRSRLPYLVGGPLPPERLERLIPKAGDPALEKLIRQEIEENLERYQGSLAPEGAVAEERLALQEEWKTDQRRLEVAPGEEILTRLFELYGLKYNKGSDSVRIARAMIPEEIPEEIKEIISATAALGRAP